MFHRSLLTLALTLLAASPAHAATTFITPGLHAPIGGSLQCRVVNGHATQTIEFALQIFAGDGDLLVEILDALEPLTASPGFLANASARFCIVTLLKGSRAKIRVTVSIHDSSGDTLAALEGRP